MLKIGFFGSRVVRTYYGREIKPRHPLEETATDRHDLIPGFDQTKLSSATVDMIGGGGIGSEVGLGLAKKGIGALKIYDPDVVELSNLSRQFFSERDLYRNKAVCLARNLSRVSIARSKFTGHSYSIAKGIEEGVAGACDVGVVGVDDNQARLEGSHFYLSRGIPVVITAVNREANQGYVFVQEKGGPCFRCIFPDAIADSKNPCPRVGAAIDVVKVVAGIVIYAIDSLLMKRARQWNYKEVHLAGFLTDKSLLRAKRADCPVCVKA